MTREEILAMKPGRELDALVAEKVLNLSVERWGEYAVVLNSAFGGTPIVVADDEKSVLYRFPHKSDWVKKYSTDISAAWEVVKKMEDCLHLKEHGERGNWEAFFCGASYIKGELMKVNADTAPEAICKAALLACLEVSA